MRGRNRGGFSLPELLVVLGLLGILLCLAGRLLSLGGSRQREFVSDCYRLLELVQSVQQEAVFSGRHCYAGFWEEPFGGKPETGGLFAVGFSRGDGRAGYGDWDPRGTWEEQTLEPQELVPLSHSKRFGSLQLSPSLPPKPGSSMERPPVSRFQRLGHPQGASVTPLPIGECSIPGRTIARGGSHASGEAVAANDRTWRVIHFSPRGETRIVHQTTAGTLVEFIEIGVVPKGTIPQKNEEGEAMSPPLHAAVLIYGSTGRARLYLP